MTGAAWLKRVAIVIGTGNILPVLLVELGARWLAGGDSRDLIALYAVSGVVLVPLWCVMAAYLILFTVMHSRKSGN